MMTKRQIERPIESVGFETERKYLPISSMWVASRKVMVTSRIEMTRRKAPTVAMIEIVRRRRRSPGVPSSGSGTRRFSLPEGDTRKMAEARDSLRRWKEDASAPNGRCTSTSVDERCCEALREAAEDSAWYAATPSELRRCGGRLLSVEGRCMEAAASAFRIRTGWPALDGMRCFW